MVIAIDMIGTNLGSGTKTYNLNFCENLHQLNFKNKIYIFITRNYLKNIDQNNNLNIKYIIKSKFLENIFLRILWMQLILPFELRLLRVNHLFSPMNMGPISLRLFNKIYSRPTF